MGFEKLILYLNKQKQTNKNSQKLKIIKMKNSAKNTAKNVKAVEVKNVPAIASKEVDTKVLDMINASNIISKSENKSIFKKEHSNSSSRGKARKLFIREISLFILHTAHKKEELAKESLEKAKGIAKEYYSAEDKFVTASDYFTNGRGGNDVEIIKEFINILNPTK